MDKFNHNETFLEKVARFIVDKRRIFYLLFLVAIIFCINGATKVKVNSDLSVYLPKSTETRRGLSIVEDEFTTYSMAQIVISNVTVEKAQRLVDEIEDVKGVMLVDFKQDEDHYKNSSALVMVNFDDETEAKSSRDALNKIKEILYGYDYYVNSEVGDNTTEVLREEMKVILLISVIIIIAVLIFTSKSYAEIGVFLIVFAVAAILNMGTNYLLGEISFITDSVSIVLQLGLAVDYAIILCHRFMEEREHLPAREADIKALSKALVEISSSSLTTVSGLAALTTMQYKIGMDMGTVLIKAIFCSLTTVFLLMPGLLMIFSKAIDKTKHRNFVPKIIFWGKLVNKLKFIILPVFLIVFVFAIYFSNKTEYVFAKEDIDTNRPTDIRIAQDKIKDNFGSKNLIAVLVPAGDYEKEKKVLNEVSKNPKIVTKLGLSSVEVEGHILTDKINAQDFAELADIDIDLSKILFKSYGIKNKEYNAIFQEIDNYSVSLLDMSLFLLEEKDLGIVDLTDKQEDKVEDLDTTLDKALNQFQGENYSNLIFLADVPNEGPETEKLMKEIRATIGKYYDNVVLVGNSTLTADLGDSFGNDNKMINVFTALFVMIILLFTFQSIGLPFMLIMTIEGSIFINFAFPYLKGTNLFFLSYLVVSAIQMGATIDYAILITNRYKSLKLTMEKEDAIVEALNQSFPTVFTSGSILTSAGYVIGMLSTDPIISSIGISIGRGTFISIILVMTVLPVILNLGDKVIEKTQLDFSKKHLHKHIKTNKTVVDGFVKGEVNGNMKGHFRGSLTGDMNLKLISKTNQKEENED